LGDVEGTTWQAETPYVPPAYLSIPPTYPLCTPYTPPIYRGSQPPYLVVLVALHPFEVAALLDRVDGHVGLLLLVHLALIHDLLNRAPPAGPPADHVMARHTVPLVSIDPGGLL